MGGVRGSILPLRQVWYVCYSSPAGWNLEYSHTREKRANNITRDDVVRLWFDADEVARRRIVLIICSAVLILFSLSLSVPACD